MAEEEEARGSNGRDQPPMSGDRRRTGKDSDERSGARRKRVSPEPPVNAIQATRKPRKNRNAPEPAAAGAAAPAAPQVPGEGAAAAARPADLPHGDSDPWTVPESVRNRFVQDGHRFYFPDGAPAFKDQGRRLTTPSENTQVIHSLIEIAHSRGWTEVTVTGTERFRQEAWRQARLAGLNVRGYRPSEVEHAQMIRALARNRAQTSERVDSISADSPCDAPRPSGGPSQEVFSRADPQGRSRERIAQADELRQTGGSVAVRTASGAWDSVRRLFPEAVFGGGAICDPGLGNRNRKSNPEWLFPRALFKSAELFDP